MPFEIFLDKWATSLLSSCTALQLLPLSIQTWRGWQQEILLLHLDRREEQANLLKGTQSNVSWTLGSHWLSARAELLSRPEESLTGGSQQHKKRSSRDHRYPCPQADNSEQVLLLNPSQHSLQKEMFETETENKLSSPASQQGSFHQLIALYPPHWIIFPITTSVMLTPTYGNTKGVCVCVYTCRVYTQTHTKTQDTATLGLIISKCTAASIVRNAANVNPSSVALLIKIISQAPVIQPTVPLRSPASEKQK